MSAPMLLQFMRGALFATCLVASIFFARFYKKSSDRFFSLFSAAFAILALNWGAVSFMSPTEEPHTWPYVLRLLAFLVILAAIVDKNRKR